MAPAAPSSTTGFPQLIWEELSLPILLVGLGGVALLRRPLPFVLYGTLALYLVFNWMYRCANWYQVILPAYPLLLLGVAAAAERWEQAGRRRSGRGWRCWPMRRWPCSPSPLSGASMPPGPRADSRNRPGDTGLARAGVLLDQPLPAGASLFAQVEDALALDYLVDIWGIRPDLRVVSSDAAAQTLAADGTVLTTFDAAPVLLEELPARLRTPRQAFSADWLALGDAARALSAQPQERIDRPLTDGVILAGYTLQPAPAAAGQAVDVTLFWQLADGWPAELGISLRPTRDGAFLPDAATGGVIQLDAAAPAHGLAQPAPGTTRLADFYRLPMPADANGVMLIVYQSSDNGFENLLELPLLYNP